MKKIKKECFVNKVMLNIEIIVNKYSKIQSLHLQQSGYFYQV